MLVQVKLVDLELRSLFQNTPFLVKNVYIKDGVVCSPLEPVEIDVEDYPYLKEVHLSDPLPRKEVNVDILLGLSHVHAFETGKTIKPKNPENAPTLTETVFGYIVSGPYTTKKEGNRVSCQEMHVGTRIRNIDDLDEGLERFWNIESLGIKDQKQPLTADGRKAVEHFEETTIFNGERYVASLPFREDAVPLKNNYKKALRLLEATERRLRKDDEKKKLVSEAMQQYVDLGFAHELTPQEEEQFSQGQQYYIPSHPVFKESESSPVRMVFNASSEDENGNSERNAFAWTECTTGFGTSTATVSLAFHHRYGRHQEDVLHDRAGA